MAPSVANNARIKRRRLDEKEGVGSFDVVESARILGVGNLIKCLASNLFDSASLANILCVGFLLTSHVGPM